MKTDSPPPSRLPSARWGPWLQRPEASPWIPTCVGMVGFREQNPQFFRLPSERWGPWQSFRTLLLWMPACAGMVGNWGVGIGGLAYRRPKSCRQIQPIRIVLLNLFNFPRPSPCFHLAFARLGLFACWKLGEPDKAVAAMFAREPIESFCLVLPDAPNEIIGMADIERAVFLVCHDVDVEGHI